MTEFEAALDVFVEGANRLLDGGINKTSHLPKKITTEDGRKFVRLVVSEGPNQEARSAWGFIDKTNGNVLKAASWKAPAKNFARGNIYDKSNGLARFCWTGVR